MYVKTTSSLEVTPSRTDLRVHLRAEVIGNDLFPVVLLEFATFKYLRSKITPSNEGFVLHERGGEYSELVTPVKTCENLFFITHSNDVPIVLIVVSDCF